MLLLLALKALEVALPLTQHSLLALLQALLSLLAQHSLDLLASLVDLLLQILTLMALGRVAKGLLKLFALLLRHSVVGHLPSQLLHPLCGLLRVRLLKRPREGASDFLVFELASELAQPLAKRLTIALVPVLHLCLQLLQPTERILAIHGPLRDLVHELMKPLRSLPCLWGLRVVLHVAGKISKSIHVIFGQFERIAMHRGRRRRK